MRTDLRWRTEDRDRLVETVKDITSPELRCFVYEILTVFQHYLKQNNIKNKEKILEMEHLRKNERERPTNPVTNSVSSSFLIDDILIQRPKVYRAANYDINDISFILS